MYHLWICDTTIWKVFYLYLLFKRHSRSNVLRNIKTPYMTRNIGHTMYFSDIFAHIDARVKLGHFRQNNNFQSDSTRVIFVIMISITPKEATCCDESGQHVYTTNMKIDEKNWSDLIILKITLKIIQTKYVSTLHYYACGEANKEK